MKQNRKYNRSFLYRWVIPVFGVVICLSILATKMGFVKLEIPFSAKTEETTNKDNKGSITNNNIKTDIKK